MATHSSILAKGTEQLNNKTGQGCKLYLLLEIQDAFTYL